MRINLVINEVDWKEDNNRYDKREIFDQTIEVSDDQIRMIIATLNGIKSFTLDTPSK